MQPWFMTCIFDIGMDIHVMAISSLSQARTRLTYCNRELRFWAWLNLYIKPMPRNLQIYQNLMDPLFFILFINYLPLYITGQTDLYADDTTITCSADYKFMRKLERDLNNSVAEILSWAVTNKLSINLDKTNVMIVTGRRLDSKLDFKPSVKSSDHELVSNISSATQLGLDNTSYLSFRQHVD